MCCEFIFHLQTVLLLSKHMNSNNKMKCCIRFSLSFDGVRCFKIYLLRFLKTFNNRFFSKSNQPIHGINQVPQIYPLSTYLLARLIILSLKLLSTSEISIFLPYHCLDSQYIILFPILTIFSISKLTEFRG